MVALLYTPMRIYGALSQNQQSFATKAKFWPDCGSLALRVWGQVNQLHKTIELPLESPQSNSESMSGDFGARRGAETARGVLGDDAQVTGIPLSPCGSL
jgi:hypothetical protein